MQNTNKTPQTQLQKKESRQTSLRPSLQAPAANNNERNHATKLREQQLTPNHCSRRMRTVRKEANGSPSPWNTLRRCSRLMLAHQPANHTPACPTRGPNDRLLGCCNPSKPSTPKRAILEIARPAIHNTQRYAKTTITHEQNSPRDRTRKHDLWHEDAKQRAKKDTPKICRETQTN